eukprot:COSAG01_NODE_39293_length_478_cov_1.422164_1_plen_73_part_10
MLAHRTSPSEWQGLSSSSHLCWLWGRSRMTKGRSSPVPLWQQSMIAVSRQPIGSGATCACHRAAQLVLRFSLG